MKQTRHFQGRHINQTAEEFFQLSFNIFTFFTLSVSFIMRGGGIVAVLDNPREPGVQEVLSYTILNYFVSDSADIEFLWWGGWGGFQSNFYVKPD